MVSLTSGVDDKSQELLKWNLTERGPLKYIEDFQKSPVVQVRSGLPSAPIFVFVLLIGWQETSLRGSNIEIKGLPLL